MEQKIIVITGGSEGLGKAIAGVLSESHKVVILSRSEEKLRQVSEEIGCDYFACDVTDTGRVNYVVNQIVERYGRIDCLINNAGLWIEGELESNSIDEIEKVVDVNFTGLVRMTKEVVPHMKSAKDGIIININSRAGQDFAPNRSIYYATKWAVTGFSKCLQVELDEYGVKVINFMPDKMKTDLFNKAGNTRDLDKALDVNDVAKVVEFIMNIDKNVTIPEVIIKYFE